MAIEFKLPELGESIESADVLNVLVKPGDTIEKDQGVIEIETDKATIEVPSTVSGTVKEVKVKPGDKINVGAVLIIVEEKGSGEVNAAEPEQKNVEKSEKKPADQKNEGKESKSKEESDVKAKSETSKNGKPESSTDEQKAPPKQKADEQKTVIDFLLPELGESIESADILNVLVKAGDTISRDQAVIEIETDKATIEVPSTVDGKITEVLVKAGEKAKVGQIILRVESSAAPAQTEDSKPKEQVKPTSETKSTSDTQTELQTEQKKDLGKKQMEPGEVDNQPPILKGSAPAAPSVRRLSRELGIDINQVKGTGEHGRISLEDVKLHVKTINEERNTGDTRGLGIKQETLPDFSKYGSIETRAMNKIRKVTAEHLSYAWVSIPHVTQFDKADITELEKFRKTLSPKVEKSGGKLTVTGILVKVLTTALKTFPQFNSSVDMEKHEIIYKNYFNIGIAVDTDNGLMVPVIKNSDKKNLTEISFELNLLAEKARSRKIGLEDIQGACITITNLGGIGGTYFTPIVNSPEVAILGVSRGSYVPVYIDGIFEPRMMLPLSLSYDHRVIDGADAARFLRWVCEVLEQPMKLWLDE